jgi:Amt family ammonium transporter
LPSSSTISFGYDDSLDVVGVHFVSGLVGSLAVGLFANPAFFGLDSGEGPFYGGGFSLLGEQLFANVAVAAYWFGVTLLTLLILKRTIGIRVSEEVETASTNTCTTRSPTTSAPSSAGASRSATPRQTPSSSRARVRRR